MEHPTVYFNKEEYIETSNGNRVSRSSILCGSANIRLAGKAILTGGTMIRGDLGKIEIGRYTYVGPNTVLRPPFKIFGKSYFYFTFTILANWKRLLPKNWFDCGPSHFWKQKDPGIVVIQMTIGDHVTIEEGAGRRCVLNDCCVIMEGTVLPPDTVVRSYSVVGGCPGNADTRHGAILQFHATKTKLLTREEPGLWHHSNILSLTTFWSEKNKAFSVGASRLYLQATR